MKENIVTRQKSYWRRTLNKVVKESLDGNLTQRIRQKLSHKKCGGVHDWLGNKKCKCPQIEEKLARLRN